MDFWRVMEKNGKDIDVCSHRRFILAFWKGKLNFVFSEITTYFFICSWLWFEEDIC